jgi:membrane protein YqaA with SNARE-associated domain
MEAHMDSFDLVREAGWFLGTFVYCLAAGLVPFLSTEAYLLWLAMAAPREQTLPLLATASIAHMAAKSVLYAAGRGVVRLPVARDSVKLAAMRRTLGPRGGSTGVAFASALTGLPPFYWFSLAAGALRFRFLPFVLGGGAGRTLRFAAVLFLPQGFEWGRLAAGL